MYACEDEKRGARERQGERGMEDVRAREQRFRRNIMERNRMEIVPDVLEKRYTREKIELFFFACFFLCLIYT